MGYFTREKYSILLHLTLIDSTAAVALFLPFLVYVGSSKVVQYLQSIGTLFAGAPMLTAILTSRNSVMVINEH